ncbi:Tagatose 6 phosphate kinase [Proteiniphilum saccharofermentans]|uniref:Tagatose 6 phosphate kinase n=1 Tax=Proteiniphilum saccharofermentans TaxID=1642647 RepID=A0A1R3T098_9BACT|nr:class II D-tagatose-bisphosphate aldolase, non-catalytic subunit [Proteiniphilum saccharofermentans]SCD21846.1 Tagatose 6 phosphate kinase [Proteiniphilum saccharofermentans]
MPKTENILKRIEELKAETNIPRTLFAVCPNSISVIKAAFRAAKRNNAPIKFAATLNQIDSDKGYVGITQNEFTKMLEDEARSVNFEGPYIVAIDHGGPWLKDKQSLEKWKLQRAMDGVKKSFEDAIEAGYDLIHVDPTVDIFIPEGEIIDIKVVVQRTVELIKHSENFRRQNNHPIISYEVGTEEVHGGLADENTFDTFIELLKRGLKEEGLSDVWPCFIVGKVGTDLHTNTFDKEVATTLTKKVKQFGSYIKGHYTDGVLNPQDYPLCGIGAANVGPEFTISEYDALVELEELERKMFEKKRIAVLSNMKKTLWRLVLNSNRWQKWLQPEEKNIPFEKISTERKEWLIKTGCRYIWQNPEAVVARYRLYENLKKNGINAEEIVLSRIERDMDKYFYAFNLVNLNNYLT